MTLSPAVPAKPGRAVAPLGRLRVVLVDQNEFLRAGLKAAIWAFGVVVVGEAVDAEDAVAVAERLSPAAIIVGQLADRGCPIDATRRLAAAMPTTPIMVLADSTDRDHVTAAVRAGARGYMLNDAPKEAIAGAVRAIAAGDSVVSSKIAGHLLEEIRNGTIDGNGGGEMNRILDRLTHREIEVLRLIASGNDNSAIARALNISPSTAKNHTASILAKLHLENRIQAAVYAVRGGLA
jgi:two-component system nitrate/nitrite response regulator NarL